MRKARVGVSALACGLTGSLALVTALTAGRAAGQEVPDSLAHPIVAGCGDRIDPPAYLRAMKTALVLTSDEERRLAELEDDLRAKNRPLGVHWAEIARKPPGESVRIERAGVLRELRTNYAEWYQAVVGVVGAERATLLRNPPDETRDPRIRCLQRSVIAILGL